MASVAQSESGAFNFNSILAACSLVISMLSGSKDSLRGFSYVSRDKSMFLILAITAATSMEGSVLARHLAASSLLLAGGIVTD